jgi:NAD(P)-dependent dehydrogenase (short-subunit alcohol dehydrogenase family)
MSQPEVVLITGCASGIGKRLAEAFYADGRRVVMTDVNIAALYAAGERMNLDPDRALIQELDVRDETHWRSVLATAVNRWGRVDVALNVAGYLRPGEVGDLAATEIDRHLDINAKGVILGTTLVARQMRRQGGGHVINIASLAGLAPTPGLSLYSASKFAVRGFSLAAALELKSHNIAVTVICPDAVQTPMLEMQMDRAEAALTFTGARILTVDDILAAVRVARRDKPFEIVIPRRRGWLAKFAGAFPSLAPMMLEGLKKRGLARQRELRDRRDA